MLGCISSVMSTPSKKTIIFIFLAIPIPLTPFLQ
nr:MAG TPA: hypothetical protein [Caudoviricetes sp.]